MPVADYSLTAQALPDYAQVSSQTAQDAAVIGKPQQANTSTLQNASTKPSSTDDMTHSQQVTLEHQMHHTLEMSVAIAMQPAQVTVVTPVNRCISCGGILVKTSVHLTVLLADRVLIEKSSMCTAGRKGRRERGRAEGNRGRRQRCRAGVQQRGKGGCTPFACALGVRLCLPVPTLRSCVSMA